MFNIGVSELLVIAVVALLFIGPEQLPAVARTAGKLMGRLQRYITDIKAEFRNEAIMEEWRTAKNEAEQGLMGFKSQVSLAHEEIKHEIHNAKTTLEKELASTNSPDPTAQPDIQSESLAAESLPSASSQKSS